MPALRSAFRLFLMLVFANLVSCGPGDDIGIRYSDLVDPFIGTGGKGKTYPGATVPFGMVQLSPDNGRNGWDWISGYFYPDSILMGFSHTHLSGTGIGDLYDISFFPVTFPLQRGETEAEVYSRFSHDRERAEPGYYAVLLDDYGIDVELTATLRTGLQRYRFPPEDSGAVRLNLGYARNWDSTTGSYLHIVNDTLITGYRKSTGWARDQRVYFATRFSRPFGRYELAADTLGEVAGIARGKKLLATFFYAQAGAAPLLVKTGISSVSVENALANLESELPGWDFDETRRAASDRWEAELSKIRVQTTNEDHLRQFYTALYQSMLAPTVFSDVNGEYKGPDGHVHRAEGHQRYTTFSLWDTFRAAHPLFTILQPERVADMVNSMLDHYDEYGLLPVWDLVGNETDMMIGYHAVPVITDAYLKGIRGFDAGKALEAMKKSATRDHFGLQAYRAYGYIPYEEYEESVSLALEYAYDDWCIAEMARALGREEDFTTYQRRAGHWKPHFDPVTGFMRGKDKAGNWRLPFDPLVYNSGDYIEANAWQYNFFVPHDVPGLIEAMGGPQRFVVRLDSMFDVEQVPGELPEWISGFIGQYVHGNEPGHHVPYLYNYAGAPWKTQERVRSILTGLYNTRPEGICGNEDCGQMSAWYVFSALGFYPVNPAAGTYDIGSPLFDKAVIDVGNGQSFRVVAKDNSVGNPYVQRATLNGKPLARPLIRHQDIMAGGELILTMGPSPTAWE